MSPSALDLAPAGGPAPRIRQVLAHAGIEAALMLRNGEQLLLALVIPFALLAGGRWLGTGLGWSFDAVAASVLGLAMWSTCFTSLAITTGFERRYNVLERLAGTPLGTSGILLGKSLAFALVTLGQLAVLAAAALALGWRPGLQPAHLLVAVASSLLAMGAFAALGLALAGSQRAEITLGLANLVYLAGMAGGLMLPLARFPGWAQPFVASLPTAALGEALRSGSAWAPVTLAVWFLAGIALARGVFAWTS